MRDLEKLRGPSLAELLKQRGKSLRKATGRGTLSRRLKLPAKCGPASATQRDHAYPGTRDGKIRRNS